MTNETDKKTQLNALGEKGKIEHLKKFPLDIKYIDKPSEMLQVTAVRVDGMALEFIRNPTTRTVKTAIFANPESKKFLVDPGEDMLLYIKDAERKHLGIAVEKSDEDLSPKEKFKDLTNDISLHFIDPETAPYAIDLVARDIDGPEEHISEDDGRELADLFKSYGLLASLSLDYNDIGQAGMDEVQNVLLEKQNENLVYVNFANAPKQATSAKQMELLELCEQNKTEALALLEKIQQDPHQLNSDDISQIDERLRAVVAVAETEKHMSKQDIANLLAPVYKHAKTREEYLGKLDCLPKPILGGHTKNVAEEPEIEAGIV